MHIMLSAVVLCSKLAFDGMHSCKLMVEYFELTLHTTTCTAVNKWLNV